MNATEELIWESHKRAMRGVMWGALAWLPFMIAGLTVSATWGLWPYLLLDGVGLAVSVGLIVTASRRHKRRLDALVGAHHE